MHKIGKRIHGQLAVDGAAGLLIGGTVTFLALFYLAFVRRRFRGPAVTLREFENRMERALKSAKAPMLKSGDINTKLVEKIAREAVRDIGYEQKGFHWKKAKVEVLLHGQSADIAMGVDAAGNNHAQAMLERDVANLRNYFGQFAAELLTTQYGREIWSHYEAGTLTPDVVLTGRYERQHKAVDMESVLREIEDTRLEEAARLLRMQE